LFYYIWLGTSLFFLTLTKDPLVQVFIVALFIDFATRDLLPTVINQNQIPRNTGTAFTVALFAFGIFIGVTFVVTLFFQGTAVKQGTVEANTIEQLVFRNGFAATGLSAEEPIFANSKLLTFYQFGIVIPFIETRLIIRIWEFLTRTLGIALGRFSFRMALVMLVVSGMFMFFHAEVKGVEDNVALLMTFIFAFMSLEFARRTKEMEGPTYFHVINNLVFIFNKIGF